MTDIDKEIQNIKEVFRENLNRYFIKKGCTQKELATFIGVSPATINEWLKGRKSPRMNKVDKLCDFFACNRSDLMEKFDATNATSSLEASVSSVRIPVLGHVAAGVPIAAIQDIIDYEEISEAMARGGEFFGLIIEGTSMQPTINNGDIVIVRQQREVENGEIAVVLVNGNDATVKEIQLSEAGLTLIGHNPAVFPPKFYTKEEVIALPVTIIGKVVEMRRKF